MFTTSRSLDRLLKMRARSINQLTNNNKLQIGHRKRKPSQFARSWISDTPWPMRDVKDNAIYRKSSK